ncbi:DUF2520 domain-containing protein [Microbacterium sp. BK668]|uniref:DUF2520 domain-containing protein n=1 Tax=Microbacterium sp. BK668 TaxID=2512118 RepID=UPI00105C474D|nr:DUF2520 domain-containing protein [Microbacterium sp. BK668]TDN91676.1 putative short-subunit dehydrogenase-like oxidoreductase (DUF2520 family) [Microbacterium sp. BK668]
MSPAFAPSRRAVTTVSIVGAGRLGTALARALAEAGVEVRGPFRRGEPPAPAEVALLCVPDHQIAEAARASAATAAHIGHTSGATTIADVDFGLHPLQTFAGDEGPEAFRGIGCAIAGRTPEALSVARSLAAMLGAAPFEIADSERPAYHAAASIASNYLVTLQAAAEEIATATGLTRAEARSLLAPLVRTTVDNWAAHGPEAALTGPIARGDEVTVARQRDAVARHPDLLPLFDVLAERTRALAAGKERRP